MDTEAPQFDPLTYTQIDDLTVKECFERLKLVTNKTTYKDIAIWLGKTQAEYNNWRRTGKLPWPDIIRALLKEGISLDWFCAPGQQLSKPQYSYSIGDYTKASVREHEQWQRLNFLNAHRRVVPLMKKYGLEGSRKAEAFLLDCYLLSKDNFLNKEQAVELIARALAMQPPIPSEKSE
ncbi:hypothetical protein [Idiomarina piscisalsi]|uniref:Bacteriophage CI repressor n=1 Tax=Idiomarina piscisalsi TaxID=1096243 RepID=A0ABM6LUA5_9GAMM|nr:hypothetical protein [Idiomarina piscisalsi]ASG66137.1 hypothetical protein CEW91_08265 [Idiomarina piscisalsi]MTJ01969.1 hypothetical protein [Idiomarina piscisalsi]